MNERFIKKIIFDISKEMRNLELIIKENSKFLISNIRKNIKSKNWEMKELLRFNEKYELIIYWIYNMNIYIIFSFWMYSYFEKKEYDVMIINHVIIRYYIMTMINIDEY